MGRFASPIFTFSSIRGEDSFRYLSLRVIRHGGQPEEDCMTQHPTSAPTEQFTRVETLAV